MGTMGIRSEIVSQFTQVAVEQGRNLAPLTDDLPLLDLGLDSLSFAIVVARLEDVLGVDPFTIEEGADVPVTFGDLVGLYERSANQPQ